MVGASHDGTRVFVAGSEEVAPGESDYVTRALEAVSGGEVWTSRYEYSRTFATPTVLLTSADDETVYVTGDAGIDFATVAHDTQTGEQLWSSRYSGPLVEDWAYAMGQSPDGATLFVAGASQNAQQDHDIVTVAYDSATGAELWVARYDGPGYASDWDDWANRIVVAPDGGTVFVTGYSAGVGTDWDIVTLAYDAATGEQRWVARRNGSASREDSGAGVAISPDGAFVYVAGYMEENNRGKDCVVLAYDAGTGEERWVSLYDGPPSATDGGTAIVISSDGRTLFVNGTSRGTSNPRDFDVLTLALDAGTGGVIWTARYDGPFGGNDLGETIALSPDGTSLFVGGSVESTSTNRDAVVVAYEAATGRESWVARYDGPAGQYDAFRRISVNPLDSTVYAIGNSTGVGTNRDWVVVSYVGQVTQTITIDIKPDAEPNVFNPRSRGVIPVAVLGEDSFDVGDIDPSTLRFGPALARPLHDLSDPDTWSDHLKDVNADGIVDLVLHFRTQNTGLGCLQGSATLTGSTVTGQDFTGSDAVEATGCFSLPWTQEVEPQPLAVRPRAAVEGR